jgi:hypothetical protein
MAEGRVAWTALARIAATDGFDFQKASVGNEPPDHTPLECRSQSGKGIPIGSDRLRKAGDLVIEVPVFLTQDVRRSSE